jgi:hypothetical protein
MKLLPLLLLFLATGCSAVVSPPARIDDPVPIYFANYNVHSTILLPHDGKYIDFAYCDWNYAALRHKFINDAVGALTISGCATLERRGSVSTPTLGSRFFTTTPTWSYAFTPTGHWSTAGWPNSNAAFRKIWRFTTTTA